MIMKRSLLSCTTANKLRGFGLNLATKFIRGGYMLSSLTATCLLIALSGCASPTPTQTPPPPTDTEPTTTPIPEPTDLPDTPTPTRTAGSQRVILVSLEGGRADWFDHLTTLAEHAAGGTVTGVDPASGAVSHHSLSTGLEPAKTGISAERVHRSEDGLYWYTSGYDLPLAEDAPAIWQTADQNGLTTAALFWPGATVNFPKQLADYTVDYGEREVLSTQHKLTFTSTAAQTWDNAPESDNPYRERKFEIVNQDELLATVYVLAIDSGQGYDTFILSRDDRIVDELDIELSASPGSWAAWNFHPDEARGADFLITDPTLETFTLFQSAVYRLAAAPDDFRQTLAAEFGYFPPPPDYYALTSGWINAEQFMDMVRRQSDWMMDVTIWVDQTYHPDLLLTVQSPLDQAGYQFLLVDERQPNYSAELAEQYAGYLDEAAAQTDDVLSRLYAAVEPEIERGETTLFAVGTTGLTPIHTQVNLNILLSSADLLKLGGRGYVITQSTQAIAFASGGTAHIYINLVGREQEGIVLEENYEAVQTQVIELLEAQIDPVTSEPVFADILTRDEIDSPDPNIGDIVVRANPGYNLSDSRTALAAFEPVTFYGQQGYSPQSPDMQTGWAMIGLGLEPGQDLGNVDLLDFAPTILNLLGITDLPETDGQVIAALE